VTADFEATLRERFAAQDDSRERVDLDNLRSRAERHRERPGGGPVATRRFLSRRILVALAAAALIAAGAGAGVAITAGSPPPVTSGFSALDDRSLPRVTNSPDPSLTMPYRSVLDMFLALGPGPYDGRRVAPGMYLARRGDVLCHAVIQGSAQCRDHLEGDVWFEGTQRRAYDAETAPFEVDFYGFARDSVSTIRVTVDNRPAIDVPTEHNAFRTTLKNATFADISGITVVYTSGKTIEIDPRAYGFRSPPRPSLR
jgi:hypothetical protein